MSIWISITERKPKEADDLWYRIKVNNVEVNYPVRFWEHNEGRSDFVNISFAKEVGVTHWRKETVADRIEAEHERARATSNNAAKGGGK